MTNTVVGVFDYITVLGLWTIDVFCLVFVSLVCSAGIGQELVLAKLDNGMTIFGMLVLVLIHFARLLSHRSW